MRSFHLLCRSCLLLFVIIILTSQGISSATPLTPGASIIVNTTEDEYDAGPSCSLREAIQAANTDAPFGGCPGGSGADVITIQRSGVEVVYKVYLSRSGSYGDDNATGDLNITSDMTIQGDGMHTTVIDAQYVLPNRSRIFRIENPAMDLSVTIKDLSLFNGYSRIDDGGSIFNRETLLLEDVGIQGSRSDESGGAIASSPFMNATQSLTLRNCQIVGNSSELKGGGINSYGNLTITNTIISSNNTDDYTYGFGGGLYSDAYPGNSVAITGSVFNDNTAALDGGNLFITSNNNTALIENSSFTGGRTEYGDGGNIYTETDPEEPLLLTIRHTEISDGYAGFALGANQAGGGIYSAVPLTLENVTLSGNFAQTGGGIYSAETQSPSVFKNITVAFNTHEALLGAGIYKAGAGAIQISNSIVSLNGSTCSGHYCDCSTGGVPISSGYNLGHGDSCGFINTGDKQGTVEPLIGPLKNNGGLSQTHALLPDSPAIDTGLCETGINDDQRGWYRPVNGACDIGAFEMGMPSFLPLILKTTGAIID
ncbi:MAG: CSLREA domain-containing protein [Anaerolineaceae bacterium]